MNANHPDALEAQALQCLTDYLALPLSERANWLNAYCKDRNDLKQAVLRMAEREAECGDFLEAGPALPDSPDPVGRRIGRYELIEEIGRGGMGAVYRARRADGAFEQEVAVKLFLRNVLSDQALHQFATERQILANLEHPGIARLIDGGNTEDGTPYVVMELIAGEPVTDYCDRRALDLENRLKLFRGVCQTLDAAHAKGVVHRDIKAGNVLATADGHTKVIDFGIAKIVVSGDAGTGKTKPAPSLPALTPEYASPEQVRGQAVGPASDIYSLGVLLYELLTGSRPSAIGMLTPTEIERVVCDTIPPDPSRRVAMMRSTPPAGMGSRHVLRKRLRGDLDRIVMTALQKSPAKRYPSAAAFADDIERYLQGMPVVARGNSLLYRLNRFVARNRVVVAAIVFAFATLLAGLLAVSLQMREARTHRDLAMQEARRALSAKDFLVDMIGRADPFESPGSATLVGAIKQSIADIETRFSGQPRLEADVRYAIGFALQSLGEVAEGREQLEKALALRQQDGTPLDIAEVLNGLAIVCWWENDFRCGERHFTQALELLGEVNDERSHMLRIDVLSSFSGMLADAKDFARSVELGHQALALADEATDVPVAALAAIWGNLATAQEGLKAYDQAAEAFDRTLSLQRRATGEMHPAYAVVLNNQSHLFSAMGDFEQAIANLEESLRIRRRTLGDAHPQVATVLLNLAHLRARVGDFPAAEQHGLEALDIAKTSYRSGHPHIGKAHEALAGVYMKTDRTPLARRHALLAREVYSAAGWADAGWLTRIDALLADIESKDRTEGM